MVIKTLSKIRQIYLKYRYILPTLLMRDQLDRLQKSDFLICYREHNKTDLIDGLKFSKYMDTISDNLESKGYSTIQFVHPYAYINADKCYRKPVVANRGLFFAKLRDIVFSPVKKLFLKSPSKEKLEYYQILFYKKLLDKVKPLCVINIWSPPQLCFAARLMNINVVEVLHGIGYPFVPWGWDKEERERLPTHIITFDAVSTNTFGLLHKKHGVSIIQIRNVWIERFLERELSNHMPDNWKRGPWDLAGNRKCILISLQWGYDGDHPSFEHFNGILKNGIMAKSLEKVIKKTSDAVYYFIRLHPVQIYSPKYKRHREYINSLCNNLENAEWKASSELPLPLLLSKCEGHITMISQTSYEAAEMGVKSLLLCPTLFSVNQNYFRDLCDNQYATKGDYKNIEFIENWILNTRNTMPFGSAYTNQSFDSIIDQLLN